MHFTYDFFDRSSASDWVSNHVTDFATWEDTDQWVVHELEIKLMPSGAYRAGIVFVKSQMELDV
jgi:hypothetical protein